MTSVFTRGHEFFAAAIITFVSTTDQITLCNTYDVAHSGEHTENDLLDFPVPHSVLASFSSSFWFLQLQLFWVHPNQPFASNSRQLFSVKKGRKILYTLNQHQTWDNMSNKLGNTEEQLVYKEPLELVGTHE